MLTECGKDSFPTVLSVSSGDLLPDVTLTSTDVRVDVTSKVKNDRSKRSGELRVFS
jgi:hypothetical protein